MAKITHDLRNRIEIPTLLLQNKTFETIGKIANASDLTYKENLNSANEISFTVPYSINDEINPLWDKIIDRKITYIPEYHEKFSISVSINDDSDGGKKTITGTGLCEYELSGVKLYNIEINTENDMAREDYDSNFPSVFYRDLDISLYDWSDSKYNDYTDEQKLLILKNSSMLHRVMEKASNYSIKHVDDTLKSLGTIIAFTIDDTDIYSELTGEISESYGVKFEFDSEARTVSAYDLYNTCDKCGYRGDFNISCPDCNSTEFHGQYGKDTTVFISRDNIANSLTREGNESSYFNTFYIAGGDDNMDAAIANVNPIGGHYIYYFSPETLEDMPISLSNKIQEYNTTYDNYIKTTKYYIDDIDNANSVIEYIKKYYPDTTFKEFKNPMDSFEELSEANYSLIDLDLYLRHEMMPTPIVHNESLEQSIALLTSENLSPVSISNNLFNIEVLNKAIIGASKIQINTSLYDIDVIDGAMYDSIKHTWVGKIKLTTIADKTKTATTDTLNIIINNDVEEYVKKQIQLKMKKSDLVDAIDITNMDISESEFKDRCHYYCLTSLESLRKELEVCRNVISESKSDFESQTNGIELYNKYYNKYNNMIGIVTKEESTRRQQLEYITIFHNNVKNEISYVKNKLNFQTFLGDEWNDFCAYRKESKYKNDNYISDGLSNEELLSRANDLIKIAKRELYKAGTSQYSISSSINNLLAIPEFEPLWDSFEIGNWINVEVNDVVYKLRLLSYQIEFSVDNIKDISVEFSTVTNAINEYSDIQSVLESAKSISNSYSGLTQQMTKTTDTVKQVNSWVDNGFDATANQIVDSLQEQNIVFDKSGILCRSYQDMLSEYDPCQLKIISNGLYCTDNNWETVKAAIGKYIYIDPVTNETKIAFGILAENIVGKQIISEKNIITNGNGSVIIDGNGIALKGGSIKWIDSPPINSTKFKYCLSDSDEELLNETEWVDTPPDKQEGKYMWQKCTVTYANGTEEVTLTCISGNDGKDAISIIITSDNGTVFKNNIGTTTLTAHVFVGGVEQYVADNGLCKYGTVNWYKGTETTIYATSKSITITADMIDNTENYIAKLEGEGEEPQPPEVKGSGDSSASYIAKAIQTDFETSILIEQKQGGI